MDDYDKSKDYYSSTTDQGSETNDEVSEDPIEPLSAEAPSTWCNPIPQAAQNPSGTISKPWAMRKLKPLSPLLITNEITTTSREARSPTTKTNAFVFPPLVVQLTAESDARAFPLINPEESRKMWTPHHRLQEEKLRAKMKTSSAHPHLSRMKTKIQKHSGKKKQITNPFQDWLQ